MKICKTNLKTSPVFYIIAYKVPPYQHECFDFRCSMCQVCNEGVEVGIKLFTEEELAEAIERHEGRKAPSGDSV